MGVLHAGVLTRITFDVGGPLSLYRHVQVTSTVSVCNIPYDYHLPDLPVLHLSLRDPERELKQNLDFDEMFYFRYILIFLFFVFP